MLVKRCLLIVIAIFGSWTSALAEGDPKNGKELAGTYCARCHGIDGNARSTRFQPVPMLAGQPAIYLVQEMQNYVSGKREDKSKNLNMQRVLSNLSNEDFQDLAAYYESEKRY